jgi:putative ABC transport system permease protein
MIDIESIRYSLRNLKKRKGRSFLTVLSILMGITAIFIFISFGLGLFNYVDEFTGESSLDKITIMPKGAGAPGLDDTFALTDKDLRAIEKTSGVYEASGMYTKVAEIQSGSEKKFSFLVGYDPNNALAFELFDLEMAEGRVLSSGDDKKVMLGYNYLLDDKIFSKGLELNGEIKIQGEDLRIIGFLESVGNPQDDSQVYTTLDYAEELYGDEIKGFTMIIARVDVDNVDLIIERIEKSLRKSRGLDEGKEDFFVQSFQDLLETYTGVLNGIVGFVILIALVSVFVSAINTSNTMITSVLERVKEVGIMKSVGSRNNRILGIFLFESGFLGFVAGSAGVLLGWILTSVAGNILLELGWGFLQPHYSPFLFIGLILFATLTGAISGVIPAIRASKISPVEALRHE